MTHKSQGLWLVLVEKNVTQGNNVAWGWASETVSWPVWWLGESVHVALESVHILKVPLGSSVEVLYTSAHPLSQRLCLCTRGCVLRSLTTPSFLFASECQHRPH